MTIVEALNQNYRSVRRTSWPAEDWLRINVNTGRVYIHTRHCTNKWNPTEFDLTATDWEVIITTYTIDKTAT